MKLKLISLFAITICSMCSYANDEQFKNTYGQMALDRLIETNNIINEGTDITDIEKIKKVNNWFNEFKQSTDLNLWGKKDYWANEIEFIGVGGGDCEDFAIAKYKTLLKMGVKKENLSLMMTKMKYLSQNHMVVVYTNKKNKIKEIVLDSRTKDLKSLNKHTELLPLYYFNKEMEGSKILNNKTIDESKILKEWKEIENSKTLNQPILLLWDEEYYRTN